MRKRTLLILLALLLISFLFNKCRRESHDVLYYGLNAKNLELIRSIIKMQHEDQKASYLALTPADKCLIWKIHLNDFRMQGRLSNDQNSEVISLIDYLSPDVFVPNSRANSTFREREAQWHSKFASLFGDRLAKRLLNDLASINITDTKIESLNAGSLELVPFTATPPCECSRTSDYCSCPPEYAPYHCPWCQTSSCTQSSSGCGTLWLYSCNGMCKPPAGGEVE